MVVEPINNGRIKIRLSNTESVTQNIYKYTTLDEIKETKSTSSTCSYFLTTKNDLGNELLLKFNNNEKLFLCDVKKTLACFEKESEIINSRDIVSNFRGNLNPFYESLNIFKNFTMNQLNIGHSSAKLDSNDRYNMYFDNNNRNASIFRNGIIAVLCDLVIEEKDDRFIIYPEIKEELRFNDDQEAIINNISNYVDKIRNEDNNIEEIVRLLIQEAYKLLTYIETEKR